MRKTHLNISEVTLLGTTNDYLGKCNSYNFTAEGNSSEGRAAGSRHSLTVINKKRVSFSIEEMITLSSVRQTNLNLTVFSVGAANYLGTIESASVKITTGAKDGSGSADEYEMPYALSTEMEIAAKMYVDGNTALMSAWASSGTSSLDVTVTITVGGATVACPMTVTNVKHSMEVGDFQMYDVTFKQKGTPTTASGHGLLVSILTGSAGGSYTINSGSLTYSGSWLISSATLNIQNSSLVSLSADFLGYGAPTIA